MPELIRDRQHRRVHWLHKLVAALMLYYLFFAYLAWSTKQAKSVSRIIPISASRALDAAIDRPIDPKLAQFVSHIPERPSPSISVTVEGDAHLNGPSPAETTAEYVDNGEAMEQDKLLGIQKLERLGVEVPRPLKSIFPGWSKVEETFGSKPVIMGLETCAAYRESVPLERRAVAPAGMFNTGTNLFPALFHKSCKGFTEHLIQANWGKHNPVGARLANFTIPRGTYQQIPPHDVLPVVIVRHPVAWMKSTCRHSYGAVWNHSNTNCPHLVWENTNDTHPVVVKVWHGWNYSGRNLTYYPSLAHLWKNWYQGYFQSVPFPRLIVRLEDLVYYPDQVIPQICACGGGEPAEEVKVIKNSVKLRQGRELTLGRRTAGQVQAWMEHVTVQSMWEEWEERDRQFARAALDGDEMMKAFNYHVDW